MKQSNLKYWWDISELTPVIFMTVFMTQVDVKKNIWAEMTELKSCDYIISIKSCEKKCNIRKVRIMSVYSVNLLTSPYYVLTLLQAYYSYDHDYYQENNRDYSNNSTYQNQGNSHTLSYQNSNKKQPLKLLGSLLRFWILGVIR